MNKKTQLIQRGHVMNSTVRFRIFLSLLFFMLPFACSKSGKSPTGTDDGETTTYKNITFITIPSGTFCMGDVV